MVPSSLNTTPVVSPRLCWYESEELNVAVSTSVALELLETVKVASSLTVPVSSCATGAALTVIVNVAVSVAVQSDNV